jgi:hypothetical protein
MKPKLTTPQFALLGEIYKRDMYVANYYPPIKKLLSMKLVEPFHNISDWYISDWYKITELGRETLRELD